MTLDTHKARLTLRGHLLDMTGLPELHGENRQRDRPDQTEGNLYMKEELIMLSETQRAMGFIESQGQYRIVVFTPQHYGTEAAEKLLFPIAQHFKPTQTICEANDDFGLVLYRTERARPYTIDGWIGFPIHVRWRSTTPT